MALVMSFSQRLDHDSYHIHFRRNHCSNNCSYLDQLVSVNFHADWDCRFHERKCLICTAAFIQLSKVLHICKIEKTPLKFPLITCSGASHWIMASSADVIKMNKDVQTFHSYYFLSMSASRLSLKGLSDTMRQQHYCALKPIISNGLWSATMVFCCAEQVGHIVRCCNL